VQNAKSDPNVSRTEVDLGRVLLEIKTNKQIPYRVIMCKKYLEVRVA